MKPKKFVASTTRAALTKVREALGDDAVILSNRTTPQGVEVRAIAERDFESLVAAESVEATQLEPRDDDALVAPRPASRRVDAVVELSGAASAVPAAGSAGDAMYSAGYWNAEPEAVKPFRFVDFVRSKLTAKPHLPAASAAPVVASSAAAALATTEKAIQTGDESIAQGRGVHTKELKAAGAVLVREHVPAASSRPDAARAPRPANGSRESRGATESVRPTAAAAAVADSRPILDELRALREFMAERFDQLAVGGEGGTNLVEAMLRRELLNAGFQSMIVRAALESLPAEFAAAQARDWVEARLTRSLACSADDIVDTGGVFALTGATGVGKTTTAAKLAARCAVRYGADSVGLITTDTYRIGAPDQLRIYGKILGVPVHTVHDPQWMQRTLDTLAGRRMVIIDTMGMGQRDGRVGAHLEMLDRCQVKRLLLLAASSQAETQEEVIDLYQGRSGVGAILTKVDETVKLAPTLGVLLRYRLKLRYVTNGQRVPEDLQAADALGLVRAALASASRGSAMNPARTEGGNDRARGTAASH